MTSPRFMLDTNMTSFIIKGNPIVCECLVQVPMSSICISSITQAELLLGVAKKPLAKHLPKLVAAFLSRVDVLDFGEYEASCYAQLRYNAEKDGKSLSCMDMLIAAHALAVDAVLVTNDKAFSHLDQHLQLQDWTTNH